MRRIRGRMIGPVGSSQAGKSCRAAKTSHGTKTSLRDARLDPVDVNTRWMSALIIETTGNRQGVPILRSYLSAPTTVVPPTTAHITSQSRGIDPHTPAQWRDPRPKEDLNCGTAWDHRAYCW